MAGSALIGCLRTICGFPLEHPCEAVKTQWQAKAYLKNEVEIVREIYNIKGWSGFYVGSAPNLARCLVRNCYKYPLLVGLPRFYEEKLSISGASLKLLTGFSLALGESIISCPLERAKVYFMTTKEKTTYK